MEIVRHHDAAAFHEVAGPLLAADPVRHTTPVTVLAGILDGRLQAATLLTAHAADGRVVGAVVQSAGRVLIVSALPLDAVRPVAEALHADGATPPGVVGRADVAEAFAAAWAELTGARPRLSMASRLFELGELTPPVGVPGTARTATTHDAALLARWWHDFAVEAFRGWPPGPTPDEVVRRGFAAGQTSVLWEVDGEPVSLAVTHHPVAGMCRIAPVWTPVARRGRGFGSAVTAACSRWALDAGARHVVLFTDLANPVSNAIYPRIGYRAVEDARELEFDRPDADH